MGKKHELRFVVLTDTHLKLDADDPSSPYRCNEHAAARARYAIRALARLRPDFVVHLGDLVQAVPGFPSHRPAMAAAHQLLSLLPCPVYAAPGNHDIGDKPGLCAPAPGVSEEHLPLFDRHWGKSYASFDHGACHFVVLNSPILNSGLAVEDEQRRWLEQDLEANRGRRIFLFMHYPPFVTAPEEDEHYDNIGEPARSWLVGLAAQYGVEALFAGHVHHFFYNRHERTDCYVAPSTAFTRQDYSEFYRVAPLAEGGRDDVQKMGFLVVDVLQSGHTVRFVCTEGKRLKTLTSLKTSQQRTGVAPAPLDSLAPANVESRVGVFLRHAWNEVTELAHSGPLDEFMRKSVRNDYPLLRLWTAGIRSVRVPLGDLTSHRQRMAALAARGFRFTVFTLGAPTERDRRTLTEHRDLLEAWEVILPWGDVAATAARVRETKRESGLTTYLSVLETSAHRAHESASGQRFHHFVRHGFTIGAFERYLEPLGELLAPGDRLAEGVVFRVGPGESPLAGMRAAARFATRLGAVPVVHVHLSVSDSPAAELRDDAAIAARVAETVAASHETPNANVFLDTFVDQDRGYFVRHGLVDRRYNPRPAYRVLCQVGSLLDQLPAPIALEDMPVDDRAAGDRVLAVRAGGQLSARLGIGRQVTWRRSQSDEDSQLGVGPSASGPAMLVLS